MTLLLLAKINWVGTGLLVIFCMFMWKFIEGFIRGRQGTVRPPDSFKMWHR